MEIRCTERNSNQRKSIKFTTRRQSGNPWNSRVTDGKELRIGLTGSKRKESKHTLKRFKMEVLKKENHPLTTKEIASKCKVGVSCTLVKLRKLRENQEVEMIKKGKNYYYRLKKWQKK